MSDDEADPLYLAQVTLVDGRMGTVVMVYDGAYQLEIHGTAELVTVKAEGIR